MKKPHLTIRTTLLIILGVLNVLIAILVSKDLYASWANFERAQILRRGSHAVNALYDANRNFSLERAASLSLVYVDGEAAEFLQEDLNKSRAQADASLNLALSNLEKKPEVAAGVRKIENQYKSLQLMRKKLDAMMEKSLAERDLEVADDIFQIGTDLIIQSQNFILSYSKVWQGNDAVISRQMMFKYFVWELAEYISRQYAVIGRMIAENRRPEIVQQQELMSMDGRIQYGWDILRKYSMRDSAAEKILPFVDEAQTQYFMNFDQIKDMFYSLQPLTEENNSYPIGMELWLGMASQTVDSLLTLQDKVLQTVQKRVDSIEHDSRKEMFISSAIFLCALSLSFYCWSIIVFRVARPVNAMVNALYKATREEAYEMPKIINKHDEIGKLASVLDVFQDNARRIKQSNEELERFAYIAAHDLKSPLRAVDNISQWLEEDLGTSLAEKDRKYMDELRSRVRLMDRMLDDTLEYARIGAKMQTGESEIVNGQMLVRNIVSLLAPPKDFTIKISENLSHIDIPKLPIQQVLYNLINNALKHHDKEDGIIEIDVEANKISYVFTIRDNGPGIARQYHQKIFEMFQTLHPRDKSKGRGMGLAVVRKIITAQGGKIEVESEAGEGALFRFTWPKSELNTKGESDADVKRYA